MGPHRGRAGRAQETSTLALEELGLLP